MLVECAVVIDEVAVIREFRRQDKEAVYDMVRLALVANLPSDVVSYLKSIQLAIYSAIEKELYAEKSRPARARWKFYDLGESKIVKGYRIIYVGQGAMGARRDGWIYEHRKVMQEQVGRPLKTHEFVHHRNRDKLDNRLENLEIVSPADHPSCFHCPFVEELKELKASLNGC